MAKYKKSKYTKRKRKTLLYWLYGVYNYLDFSIYYKPKRKQRSNVIDYYRRGPSNSQLRTYDKEEKRANEWLEKHPLAFPEVYESWDSRFDKENNVSYLFDDAKSNVSSEESNSVYDERRKRLNDIFAERREKLYSKWNEKRQRRA